MADKSYMLKSQFSCQIECLRSTPPNTPWRCIAADSLNRKTSVKLARFINRLAKTSAELNQIDNDK